MKKNLKKVLSLMLVLALAMSFVACGSKDSKKVNAENALSSEELVEKIATTSADVKGVTMSGEIALGLKMSAGGQEAELSFDGSIEAKASTEPKASYTKGEFSYDLMGQSDTAKFETYSVVNGDVVEVYSYEDDEWSYNEEELSDYSDMLEEIQSSMKDFDFESLKEYCDDITSELDGDEYTVVAKISSKKIMEIAEKEDVDTSSLGLDLTSLPEFEIVLTIGVDAEKYLPTSMKVAIDMDEFEIEGTKCELTDCKIEFDVDSYDAVTIEVPEEALDAK